MLFLIEHHLRMSLVAFRRDTEDPEIVQEFAALVGTEERLKMLCLMTLADVEAVSPETLTPWKEELLWRLYVDTYNHLTQRYGDELIERNQAGVDDLLAQRPPDLGRAGDHAFLEGLPQRYLQLFSREADLSARAAGARTSSPTRCTCRSSADAVGVDAGGRHARQAVSVLEHLRRAVVVRHEHPARPRADEPERPGARRLSVHRRRAVPRAEQRRAGAVLHVLEDVVAGRDDVARLRGARAGRARAQRRPRFRRSCAPTTRRPAATPSSTSWRRTRSGLLYRISRVISQHGCDVDLVLIATEGEKAIDVFHITKGGSKLTEAEQQALTADLQRTLEETQ